MKISALRVALLDLDRQDRLLDLVPFRSLVVRSGTACARAAASACSRHHIRRSMMSLMSVTTMRGMLRPMCWSNSERLRPRGSPAQIRRDALVGNDLAAFDRKLADDFAARAVDARDRARRVVVERRDRGRSPAYAKSTPVAIPMAAASRKSATIPRGERRRVDLSSSAAWHCPSDRSTPNASEIHRHPMPPTVALPP